MFDEGNVFEAIRDVKRFYNSGYLRGFESGMRAGVDIFTNNPFEFYKEVMNRVEERGLSGFEPRLFTAPCSILVSRYYSPMKIG